MKNERKTIFVIKLIAGLLIIAFWIFLFAWADEKYLIQNSFPDREPPLFTPKHLIVQMVIVHKFCKLM